MYHYDYERPPPPPEPPSAPAVAEPSKVVPPKAVEVEKFEPPEDLEIPKNMEVVRYSFSYALLLLFIGYVIFHV